MSDYEGRFYDAMSENETLVSEIESLNQHHAERDKQVTLLRDALKQARHMIYYGEPQIGWNITRIDEVISETCLLQAVNPSEWKTNDELRKQLAATEEKRADLEFVWNSCEQELESCKSERDEARQQLAAKQAEVDALVLEYCPRSRSDWKSGTGIR